MSGIKLFIITLMTLFSLSTPALAYLDPGTGNMILQALIGIIAAGATAISIYWQKFKLFINKFLKKNSKKI